MKDATAIFLLTIFCGVMAIILAPRHHREPDAGETECPVCPMTALESADLLDRVEQTERMSHDRPGQ